MAAAELLFAHSTGFCKEVFQPLVDELDSHGARFQATALDLRGHGDSEPIEPPLDWWDFGRDVLAVAEVRVGLVGIGHSSGATALAMAELMAPGTFRALILIEPIVFPPPFARNESHPLAEGARRRRASFASPAQAMQQWRGRGPFTRWDDRALAAYVDGGLTATDQGWSLKCRPEAETECYVAATDHDAWDRLPDLQIPVSLVVGEDSSTHRGEPLDRLAARFPTAAAPVVIRGATHFVPMERPGALAIEIVRSLGIDTYR